MPNKQMGEGGRAMISPAAIEREKRVFTDPKEMINYIDLFINSNKEATP